MSAALNEYYKILMMLKDCSVRDPLVLSFQLGLGGVGVTNRQG